MAQNAGLQVSGLREFQRGLKKLSPEIDKALKKELADVAEVVAGDARRRVPSSKGRARSSVRSGADAKGPYVAGGKKSVPYFGWLDFGSRRPKKGNPRSRGPWAGSGTGPKGGRFIYPAIEANEKTIVAGAEQALAKAREAAGL